MTRNAVTIGLVAIALVSIGVWSASARAQNAGNPAILQAVQGLQASVAALQSAVDNLSSGDTATLSAISGLQSSMSTLQSTVDNLKTEVGVLSEQAQSNVRVTAPLYMDSGQGLFCMHSNVGSVPHKIKSEFVDFQGNADVIFNGDVPLDPGEATGGSKGLLGIHYCRFTVLDGTREDVRGTAVQLLGGGALGPVLSAE